MGLITDVLKHLLTTNLLRMNNCLFKVKITVCKQLKNSEFIYYHELSYDFKGLCFCIIKYIFAENQVFLLNRHVHLEDFSLLLLGKIIIYFVWAQLNEKTDLKVKNTYAFQNRPGKKP